MKPVTVDVPHRLGRDGAKKRISARLGDLAGHLPGGAAEVRSSWPGDYEMMLDITAMGQQVATRLEIQDALVRVHLLLPPMLGFFSGMIGNAVRDQGTKLLKDRSK